MSEPFDFADTLNLYVARTAYTPGQLATLSGLPKSTIVNWLQGRVSHPREWQTLVKLLSVLRLGEEEADRVLQAAGHPPLAELRRLATEAEAELLSAWPTSPARARPPVPFQAIPDPPFFVGRDREVQQLGQWLQAGETSVVQGLPGVGKTALAARLAYHLRAHFADGVLWARLSGSEPAAILDTFARAYGLDLAELPDRGSRSRVVRDLLADKQALIVLDDVAESGAVEPLLPPSGQCAVLMTTRRQNLRVALGARRLTLAPFAPEAGAARALFASILGEERVAAEADCFDEIADLVGQLPLALLVVASRLAYEPGWTTEALLARLRQQQRRLQELAYEDLSLRPSFAVGLEDLTQAEDRFFAALSVFPGTDFTPEAAAAVAGVAAMAAADNLRALHGRSLVQATGSRRYLLHPLVRDFAGELLRAEGEETVGAVRQRLIGYYRHFLHTQADRLDPTTMEAIAVEQANISGALRLARSTGDGRSYEALLLDFVPYLVERGFLEVADDLLQEAGEGTVPEAEYARWRVTIARRRRRYDEAEERLESTRAFLARPGSSRQPQVTAAALLTEEAIIAACRGDYARADALFARAEPAVRQSGDPDLLLILLKEWGAVQVGRGEYQAAEAAYGEALALARETQPVRVPALLRALGGLVVGRDRDYGQARAHYLAALEEARAYRAYPGLPILLNNLAVTTASGGDPAGAATTLEEALGLARQRGEPVPLAIILLNLGRLAGHRGEKVEARRLLAEAKAQAEVTAHEALLADVEAALSRAGADASPSPPALTVIFD